MSTSLSGYGGRKGATGAPSGLKGTGLQQSQLQNFTPEQMSLFQRLFSQVGPDTQLSKLAGGDQSQFGQLEAPSLRQFQGLQGQLGSRFSGLGGMGSLGARKSSGFANTTNQATQDFASQLQSQRMGIQRQALQDLMGLSKDLLEQRPYENFLLEKDKPKSFWENILGGLLPIAGGAIGGAFGGIPGAQFGSSIGGAAGRAFM